ncbi:MAG: glycosyltransferase family 4 protein [Acidisphaera sp.]|nr:glycosyltransferase family 4 protein [Acidisphaera sp.]
MPQARRIALLAPPPDLSSDEAFLRQVIDGLRDLGHAVERIALTAGVGWDAGDRLAVIDGAVLPALAGAMPRHAVVLVHHWTEDLVGCEGRLPPRVIATSAALAQRLATAWRIAVEGIEIVPPATDDAPRSAGSGGPGCAILSVGALIARTGHEVLLRALARLPDLDWSLTLCGSAEDDPVHAQSLAALAQETGIAGRVSVTSEPAWHEADLFALASEWEDYGTATAAALKRGLPVAVTSGGANAEQVPVEAGVVCPPGDIEGFSKALRRVIFDEALRRAMAEAAWQAGQGLPDWRKQARPGLCPGC